MFDVIGTILAWFYEWTGNYGLSIMLLTLAIMVALTPLTLKGTRSMIAMQRLQPEMKKLQARYKDDRQKLNEEMLKFYKENNINPVGGCLPLILQMPVFFVLYRVLHGLTNPHPYAQDMGRAVGLAVKDPNAVYAKFGTFDPNHLDGKSKMFQDLSNAREMKSFGLDLARSAQQTLSNGVGKALPYLVLIVIIGVTAWYQQKQIQGRNPQMQSQINPQQQMIMKFLPYFLPLISLTLPAGVVLYFLVSNLYRIGQQGFITRTMYHDAHGNPIPTTAVDTTSTEPVAKKSFLQGLKEMTAMDRPPPPKPGAKGKTNKANAKGTAKPTPKSGAKGGAQPASRTKKPANKRPSAQKQAPAKKAPPAKQAPPKKVPPVTKAPPSNAGPPVQEAPPATADGGTSTNGTNGAGAARPSRQAPAPNPEARSKRKRR